jgi:hypothetical protein
VYSVSYVVDKFRSYQSFFATLIIQQAFEVYLSGIGVELVAGKSGSNLL